MKNIGQLMGKLIFNLFSMAVLFFSYIDVLKRNLIIIKILFLTKNKNYLDQACTENSYKRTRCPFCFIYLARSYK